ncbi:MAG: chemotaxis-specific protein-glutamate methyltransferase CheB [Desulfobacteraceae bacterium]|nr:chemotaxis-specific protein-glutamate methyltransferase CheB [Desulfobacteraceae bacterium]
MLRIAIVNDRPAVVEILRNVVLSVPEYEVAWVAEDGGSAVRKCSEARPDLILLGLVRDGVQSARIIMRESPCAILIVTSDINGDSGKVFEAMGYGALDVVGIPVAGSSTGIEGGRELLLKIARISSLIRGCRLPKERGATRPEEDLPVLIAIGSSAGGPKALATILGTLPEDFPAAVVIVQHIDAKFAPGLAEWLSGLTGLPVHLVGKASPVLPGRVLVAGEGNHLVMNPDLMLTYVDEPRDAPFSPSIDVFFSSVADCWPEPSLAVLLTGMGKDGANGLLELRRAGWHTIAQDESSSVVYGMPRAAADIGAAAEVLSLREIGAAVRGYPGKARGKGRPASDPVKK